MPDEKYDALDFTAEERAEADTSIPDPEQWEGNSTLPDDVEPPADEPETE